MDLITKIVVTYFACVAIILAFGVFADMMKKRTLCDILNGIGFISGIGGALVLIIVCLISIWW